MKLLPMRCGLTPKQHKFYVIAYLKLNQDFMKFCKEKNGKYWNRSYVPK
jgi:hypothetical protein